MIRLWHTLQNLWESLPLCCSAQRRSPLDLRHTCQGVALFRLRSAVVHAPSTVRHRAVTRIMNAFAPLMPEVLAMPWPRSLRERHEKRSSVFIVLRTGTPISNDFVAGACPRIFHGEPGAACPRPRKRKRLDRIHTALQPIVPGRPAFLLQFGRRI